MKTSIFRVGAASALLVVLAACGTDSPTATTSNSQARGTLIDSPPLRIASLTKEALTAELNASAAGKQLLLVAGTPACGVDFNYIQYWTVDGNGAPVTASGALMVPTGAAPACSGAHPIVLHAHGTQVDKTANMADITNPKNTEGALVAAMFAAQGFIVVAPNYVGYDSSSATFHPYLNQDAQSKDMIDALAAARTALPKTYASSTTDSGKLFISGYSQGGYVAMATQKALEADHKVVTAAADMSGPYALEAFGDAAFTGSVGLYSTLFYPMLITSYERTYHNVYGTVAAPGAPGDFYEVQYARTIDNLLPSATPAGDLVAAGLLPPYALFNIETPVTKTVLDSILAVPANPLFSLGFGTGNLVKNSVRVAYVSDVLANPDHGVPGFVTDYSTATNPQYGLRQDLKANDLRDWIPAAPILLCGGDLDPVVFFSINTVLIANWWADLGVPVGKLGPTGLVNVLDLERDYGPTSPYALATGGFAQAKGLTYQAAYDAYLAVPANAGDTVGADAAGTQAVTGAYHGTLVPPFCAASARGFFANFLPAG